MWKEGNWVPSLPGSLAGLTAEEAAWSPDPRCHSVWQEVVHLIFWRRATLTGVSPTNEAIAQQEFALPEPASDEAWAATLDALKQTQDELAAVIQNEAKDIDRIPYHLIHDAYHLGRITQLRAMRGTPPQF